ncbi:MAG: YIP1 family protein [Acidobacteria bacterium]|nr:YIP1 family protein [Acidobacteriota bacterium]
MTEDQDGGNQTLHRVKEPGAPGSTAEADRSAWLRAVVGIVASPKSSFDFIRTRRPWLGASLLLLSASIVQFLLMLRGLAGSPAFEGILEVLPNAEALMLAAGVIFAVIGLVIGWLFQALVVWLLAVALSGNATFGRSFSLTVHVAVISCLAGFVGLLWSMGGSPESIESATDAANAVAVPGLNLLLTTDNLALETIYSSITPFSIWHLVLLGLGAAAVFEMSPRRGLLVAGIYWAGTTAFAAAAAGVAGALSS